MAAKTKAKATRKPASKRKPKAKATSKGRKR